MGWTRLDPRRRGGGALALCGRLPPARRADRRAAGGGVPRLPLRLRRRALRAAGDDGAGRAPLDRAGNPRGGGPDRLPPDGRRPGAPHRGVRLVRGRLGHLPRRGVRPTTPGSRSRRGRTASGSGSRSTRRRRLRAPPRSRSRRRADIVLCMSIHPGYSGQSFMPEALGRIEAARARSSVCRSRSTAAWGRRNVRALREAGASLLVSGQLGVLRR